MEFLACTLITGIGATALMDVWAMLRKALFGIAAPDYGLVGRWVGWLVRGRFKHESIARSSAVPAERVIGWSVHYLTGIAFAALLLAWCGLSWVHEPTLMPALAVGIVTVAAPFLLMQPGMGAGIAASRTPRPGAARLQSITTHAVFGLGLYLAGSAAGLLMSRA
jgi:hypothetical protein